MANHLKKTVYAWLVKSDYQPVWDDRGDEAYRAGFCRIPHEGVDGGTWDLFGAKDDYVLWNFNGANGNPKGGTQPLNCPNDFREFKPQ